MDKELGNSELAAANTLNSEFNQANRRRRIKLINVEFSDAEEPLLPIPACDCDNHVTCTVHCIVGDVPVDVDACGIWG